MKKIPLTNGLWTLIDDEDYPAVSKTRWYPSKDSRGKVYAKSKAHGYLHRYLMNPPAGYVVDHIDSDGLNNTRENLRLATHAQNSANIASRGGTSKHKGVSFVKSRNRWCTRLTVSGKTYQSYHATELEAMEAYNELAKHHLGEFAVLNHLDKEDEFVNEEKETR